MCIYIHPCLFLRKQREVTGVVHIGVGFLRCSFSVVGIAKALNMERTKVRFPRFFIYSFHLTFIRLPGGSQGDTHRKIGHDSCGTAYRTYASRTGTHRHLVRYPTMLHTPQCLQDIRKENIDIHLLWRISCILGHDFFRDLSDSINTGNFPSVSK